MRSPQRQNADLWARGWQAGVHAFGHLHTPHSTCPILSSSSSLSSWRWPWSAFSILVNVTSTSSHPGELLHSCSSHPVDEEVLWLNALVLPASIALLSWHLGATIVSHEDNQILLQMPFPALLPCPLPVQPSMPKTNLKVLTFLLRGLPITPALELELWQDTQGSPWAGDNALNYSFIQSLSVLPAACPSHAELLVLSSPHCPWHRFFSVCI